MAAGPANAEPLYQTAELLRERLRRLAATLEALDEQQLDAIDELVSMLERLTALLNDTPHH